MARFPAVTLPPFLQPLVQAWAVWMATTFISIPLAFLYAFWDFPLVIFRLLFAPKPKVIFITGASSGIGAEFAFTYAERGVTLGLLGRNRERLESTAKMCQKNGAEVQIIECDISDTEELINKIQEFDEENPIDLMIANAGVAGKTVTSDAGEEWENLYKPLMKTNLIGTMTTVMAAFKCMKSRGRGQIAIVSSISAVYATPHMCFYNASKAALNSFARDLRYLGRNYGIKVNVICPGFISSHMTLEPKQPVPVPDWFASSPKSLAYLSKLQLRENWSLIFWPFFESLPATVINALPPRVVDTIHYSIGKVWGYFSPAGDRGIS